MDIGKTIGILALLVGVGVFALLNDHLDERTIQVRAEGPGKIKLYTVDERERQKEETIEVRGDQEVRRRKGLLLRASAVADKDAIFAGWADGACKDTPSVLCGFKVAENGTISAKFTRSH